MNQNRHPEIPEIFISIDHKQSHDKSVNPLYRIPVIYRKQCRGHCHRCWQFHIAPEAVIEDPPEQQFFGNGCYDAVAEKPHRQPCGMLALRHRLIGFRSFYSPQLHHQEIHSKYQPKRGRPQKHIILRRLLFYVQQFHILRSSSDGLFRDPENRHRPSQEPQRRHNISRVSRQADQFSCLVPDKQQCLPCTRISVTQSDQEQSSKIDHNISYHEKQQEGNRDLPDPLACGHFLLFLRAPQQEFPQFLHGADNIVSLCLLQLLHAPVPISNAHCFYPQGMSALHVKAAVTDHINLILFYRLVTEQLPQRFRDHLVLTCPGAVQLASHHYLKIFRDLEMLQNPLYIHRGLAGCNRHEHTPGIQIPQHLGNPGVKPVLQDSLIAETLPVFYYGSFRLRLVHLVKFHKAVL